MDVGHAGPKGMSGVCTDMDGRTSDYRIADFYMPQLEVEYRRLPDHVPHNLGLDTFCQALTDDAGELRFPTGFLHHAHAGGQALLQGRAVKAGGGRPMQGTLRKSAV
ncbi:MAG: hypothetical protein IJ055_07515 [Oscillospiraceae bacterium]|nr:hypothetical protein [Oscillospiraceae bacterium]